MKTQTQNEESMENRLKAVTNHFNSLIAAIDDIVFEIDGNLIFKNVWVQDDSMLFMPKEHFIGKTIEEVMGPQSTVFTEPVLEVIKFGEPREVVYRHIDPSIHKWFKLKIRQVIKSVKPSEIILVLTIQDITYQIVSEMLLEETKKTLEMNRQLLELSQHLGQTAGWELNVNTGEIFWTKQAYMMFELTESFLPTLENIRGFIYAQDQEKVSQNLQEAIVSQKPFDIEVRIITAKKKLTWIRSIGIPVPGQQGVLTLRGAFMDISKHKENEVELIKARTETEKASKAKSDFLSIMSHEIRTPLNGIIGTANLLKLNYSKEQKEYIDNLLFSADHLMQLINDILDLTKMENDKLELALATVDLPQLLNNIKNQFQSQADAKKLQLQCTIEKEVPSFILADSVRLGQILINLISNAIKFTEKGSVVLSVNLVYERNQEAVLEFSVKDTGEGISHESRERIFESFRQLQSSSHRKHVGTGLGLAITKRLVELHGSQIQLRSKPGKGSEFYFEVAFKTVAPELGETTYAKPSVHLRGLRLLLVEDNFINIIVAKKQLEHFGISPDSAGGGEEALELLKVNAYDIALVDLHMPGMDGHELAKIIKKDYPETHIIIFTADIMSEVKEKFAALDIHDIINKPFSPDKMYKILHSVAVKKGIIR